MTQAAKEALEKAGEQTTPLKEAMPKALKAWSTEPFTK